MTSTGRLKAVPSRICLLGYASGPAWWLWPGKSLFPFFLLAFLFFLLICSFSFSNINLNMFLQILNKELITKY
jgi:hypothetical protein